MTKKVHDDDLANVSGGSVPGASFEPREPEEQVPVGKPGAGSGGGIGNTGIGGSSSGSGTQELG
jgi:hypothetical protein